jgi:hypothetical protein
MTHDTPDRDDEWLADTTDEQRAEMAEIRMMVRQIREHGHSIELDYRAYDRKFFVIMDGDKCYGQGPKIHAYLSGAYAAMDWSRSNDQED